MINFRKVTQLTLTLATLVSACAPQAKPQWNLDGNYVAVAERVSERLAARSLWVDEMANVGILRLPHAKIQSICEHQEGAFTNGCAAEGQIFISDDDLVSFCSILVHEYMHEYFYYTTGDGDAAHHHHYEFGPLADEICKGETL